MEELGVYSLLKKDKDIFAKFSITSIFSICNFSIFKKEINKIF